MHLCNLNHKTSDHNYTKEHAFRIETTRRGISPHPPRNSGCMKINTLPVTFACRARMCDLGVRVSLGHTAVWVQHLPLWCQSSLVYLWKAYVLEKHSRVGSHIHSWGQQPHCEPAAEAMSQFLMHIRPSCRRNKCGRFPNDIGMWHIRDGFFPKKYSYKEIN